MSEQDTVEAAAKASCPCAGCAHANPDNDDDCLHKDGPCEQGVAWAMKVHEAQHTGADLVTETIETAARAIEKQWESGEDKGFEHGWARDEAKAALSTLRPGSRIPGGNVVMRGEISPKMSSAFYTAYHAAPTLRDGGVAKLQAALNALIVAASDEQS